MHFYGPFLEVKQVPCHGDGGEKADLNILLFDNDYYNNYFCMYSREMIESLLFFGGNFF